MKAFFLILTILLTPSLVFANAKVIGNADDDFCPIRKISCVVPLSNQHLLEIYVNASCDSLPTNGFEGTGSGELLHSTFGEKAKSLTVSLKYSSAIREKNKILISSEVNKTLQLNIDMNNYYSSTPNAWGTGVLSGQLSPELPVFDQMKIPCQEY